MLPITASILITLNPDNSTLGYTTVLNDANIIIVTIEILYEKYRTVADDWCIYVHFTRLVTIMLYA